MLRSAVVRLLICRHRRCCSISRPVRPRCRRASSPAGLPRAGLELAREQRAGLAVQAVTAPQPGIELGDVVAFEDRVAPVATRVVGLHLAVDPTASRYELALEGEGG